MHLDIICPHLSKHLHLSTSFVRASFNLYTFSERVLARNYCHGELELNRKWIWFSQI